MKYIIARGASQSRYLSNINERGTYWSHLISDAEIFDFEDLALYTIQRVIRNNYSSNQMNACYVMDITEEKLFEARLKGT